MNFAFFRLTKSVKKEDFQIETGNGPVLVRVRRNANARKYILRVSGLDGIVTLTLPRRASLKGGKQFVLRNTGWITTKLKGRQQQILFEDGATIPFRGKPHLIVHQPEAEALITVEDKKIIVSGQARHLQRRVETFLKSEAKSTLLASSKKYAGQLGTTFQKIALKDTKSRWGSCSESGLLSYSWRLIMAPPEVLEYLCAHEVAHLKELNHSAKFWKIVEDLYPDYEKPQNWLKKHGTNLHRYGK